MKNRLSQSTNPYLLQHANNPVDWYPWGKEALEKAKSDNKPILLSIGYSACHWCHVMAHESFEDEATAKIMNQYFINIKVDREERPDLDKIYQLAHQMLLSRSGGWPLTVFLSPEDQMPFYSGTYFPMEAKYGLPAFKDLLIHIAEYYTKHQQEIHSQNTQFRLAFAQMNKSTANKTSVLSKDPLLHARQHLENDFDEINGGFGQAPKFPHPMNLMFLIEHCYQHPSDSDALKMLTQTLDKMAAGGIYDQVGSGFFRYSVDEKWMIPHFEKMLYDNAQLLMIYVSAYRLTHNTNYAKIAEEIAQWANDQMHNGGYYSTLDADSEGHEGKYYYWDREQIRALLTDEEFAVVLKLFGIDHAANFENHWHLHAHHSINEASEQLQISTEQIEKLLSSAKKKMLAARKHRIPPHRDEKILTSWNALMIKAMISAGFYLQQEKFTKAALDALDFIYNNLWANKKLLASFTDGKANFNAYLDDHAFLLDAILTVLQFHWDKKYLQFAIDLAELLLKEFQDELYGGFFFTAHQHEQLIQRPKSFMDEVTPAGNGVAAFALNRLGDLLGETRYIAAAENTLKVAWPIIEKYPSLHCGLLFALQEYLTPPQLIILYGKNPTLSEWQKKGLAGYNPHRLVFSIPENKTKLPGMLANYKNISDTATAYICTGMQCLPPITDTKKLEEIFHDK